MRRATVIGLGYIGLPTAAVIASRRQPVLVMRDTTERPEAVEAGTVKLVGTDVAAITSALDALLGDGEAYRRMSRAHNPYGDGQACQRILDLLSSPAV
jgi:UDP-N-acetylglucosamine 2-epimerase (non-hydrolysing)